MLDRHIPGYGDYSPPDEPDEQKAVEKALISAAWLAGRQCVENLREIAEEEHTTFFLCVGKDPKLTVFGDWQGVWYPIFTQALDAYAEGVRLEKQCKQERVG